MTVCSHPLLAVGFASPWLLLGLVLGGIPVVIHLLHKRRYAETRWAAMRFLIEAARKHSRRLRLEQLLLLTVRTLLLVFIVLALARPYVESFGTYFQAEAPTHRIIVVDASLSMAYRPAGPSRFEQAKQAAHQIVSNAKRGDAFNLVRIAGSEPRAIIRRPAYRKSRVAEEIEQMQVTEERGDVSATLECLVELLKYAPDISHKEITLIGDFQKDNWLPESSRQKGQRRRLLRQLSTQADLVLVDLGQSGAVNSAVTDLRVVEPFLIAGRPLHVRAVVRRFGAAARSGCLVELRIDDRLAETRRIELVPDTGVPIEFVYTLDVAGEHRVEVRLEEDALPQDDRRCLSLPVSEALDVLLVNGRHAGRDEETATYYLAKAMAPSTANKPWRGMMRTTIINEGDLPSVDLGRYACVFLCNVALLTQREAESLRAYVERGGGLIVSLGDQVQAENYNLRLGGGGAGILPARLENHVNATAGTQAEGFCAFDLENLEHPALARFEGNPNAGLETVMTFQYIRTTPATERPSRVALRFDSGDPAIVDAPTGEGRTILVTTSVDNTWGTWTVSTSFLPIMHELVLHAVSGRWAGRQLLVHESLLRTLTPHTFDMPVTIVRPDGTEGPTRVREIEGSTAVEYDGTDLSGFYQVMLGHPLNRMELAAVNIDARESDVQRLNQEELQGDLLAGSDYAYRTDWQTFGSDADVAVAERGGLSRWLLAFAFCLLLVEQLMAWKFFYGFFLMYWAVTIGFVQQTWMHHRLGGVSLLVIALVGFALLFAFRRRRLRQSQTVALRPRWP